MGMRRPLPTPSTPFLPLLPPPESSPPPPMPGIALFRPSFAIPPAPPAFSTDCPTASLTAPVAFSLTLLPTFFTGPLPFGDRPFTSLPAPFAATRSEEHTSELQSHVNLVCRLLLEKKNSAREVRRG